jgi:hypothetical protein
MKSPFPGDLRARVEESLAIGAEDSADRVVFPDVRVVEEPIPFAPPGEPSAVAVAKPRCIAIPDETPVDRWIEIVDRHSGNRVVTAIEVFSPGNKQTESSRRAYRTKQREYILGGVNLVEIDLIRGESLVAFPADCLPPDCRTPYIVCVRRRTRPNVAEIYAIGLRQSCPTSESRCGPRTETWSYNFSRC